MSNKDYLENEENQAMAFWIYATSTIFIVLLRIVRKNPEFLFFGGIITSAFLIYNFKLFRYKKIVNYYFMLSMIMAASWFVMGDETLAFVFPLITLCFVNISQNLFLKMNKREPIVDLTFAKQSDKLYTLGIFCGSIIIWLYLIFRFLNHSLI